MKKLISMAIVLLMTLSCIGNTFAAQIEPENISINGWSGWSGSAVTTKQNPVSGDATARDTMVKLEGGSAEYYFARWFTGVFELSVDVCGTGTISFDDSNGRSAGTITLADGLINNVECAYDAEAWNTVKLFVMTGSKKAEVYLGDTYVTDITLAGLVRPTKLTVNTTGVIYLDNIEVSELKRENAYTDGELNVLYASNFDSNAEKPLDGWTPSYTACATVVTEDSIGANVVKFEKISEQTTTRFTRSLGQEGSFVFETELYQPAPTDAQPQNSALNISAKNYTTAGNKDGMALNLVRFGTDGHLEMGADYISSKILYPEGVYTLGEWFKLKIEVSVESQSIDVYVATKTAGTYGEWKKINDKPVAFYNTTDSAKNAEIYDILASVYFNFNSSSSRVGLWYINNVKISEVRKDFKTVTEFFEGFDDADMTLTHYNTEGTTTNYLTLTTQMAPAIPNGTTGTAGQLHSSRNTNGSVYVGEGTEIPATAIATESTGSTGGKQDKSAQQEWFANSLNLTDAESVTLSFDYYDAAIIRKANAYNTVRDYLTIGFATVGEDGTSTFASSLGFQSVNFTFNDTKYTTKVRQQWDSVSFTLAPHSTGTKNVSAYIKENNKSYSAEVDTITSDVLQNINQLKFYVTITNGGRYYLDNLKVTKEVALTPEIVRSRYVTCNTYTDNITRGKVEEIALHYVEFEDADGNTSGIPTEGGKVKSVTIEKNAVVPAGTKLLAGVFEGDILGDTAVITVVDGTTTYPVSSTLSTTATSVVKVFIWNMNNLMPITESESIKKADRTKLVLFGGSVVAGGNADGGNGEVSVGWGQILPKFFNTNKLDIVNCAVSGASLSDFLNTSGRTAAAARNKIYTNAIASLNEGDYVMIALSNNDRDLLTDGGNVNDDISSKSLVSHLCKMIKDIEEKRATPIFVAAPPKCIYNASLGRFSFESGILQNMIYDMERIANAYGKEFINLYEMSFDFFDVGPVNSETGVNDEIYANYFVTYDKTHPNEAGAEVLASFVAKNVSLFDNGLEEFVK